MKLIRGTVVLAALDPVVGHEQRGVRPCVVVSDPLISAEQRFLLLGVVPISGNAGKGALYPELAKGKSGLSKTSYALVDQLRSIDKRRILKIFGEIRASELLAVDQGLALFLGLRLT
jgi:mRNA interferase MazF